LQIAALLIPLFVIVFAAVTKRLIPSLFKGVFAGGLLLAKGDPAAGIIYSAGHVVSSMQNADNVTIILVLFLFGAIAEIIKASGGIKGFIRTAEKRVKTEKGVYASVWLISFITFIDCCFTR
jgi:Na+/H+ antiporter NhaC